MRFKAQSVLPSEKLFDFVAGNAGANGTKVYAK